MLAYIKLLSFYKGISENGTHILLQFIDFFLCLVFMLIEFQKRVALLKQEFFQTPTLLHIRGDLTGNALFTEAFYLQTNRRRLHHYQRIW